VIGGNVSLYNESGGADIDPTPVLGVLGLVEEVQAPPPGPSWADGDAIVLLGPRAASDGSFPLEGTRWASECADHRTGLPPTVDFDAHRVVCGFVAALVAARVAGNEDAILHAVHDVSGGGLAVAAAEMAAQSPVGCALEVADRPAELFTELPSRFLTATPRPDDLCARAAEAGVEATVLGRATGDRLTLGDWVDLPLTAVCEAFEGNLTRALADS
jgi:phosphoribosylformylglycinamidine synthase